MPLIFDIETDGLLDSLSTIHCMWVYDTNTGKWYGYDKEQVSRGIWALLKADAVVGHNIIRFDIPAIKKLGFPVPKNLQMIDTLLWSKILFPDIRESDFGRWRKGELPGQLIGRYSLESWGYRLGQLKGGYGKQANAWDQWTPEMSEYCRRDVEVTFELYKLLRSHKANAPGVLELETEVSKIAQRLHERGIAFDTEKAWELVEVLREIRAELLAELNKSVEMVCVPGGEFTPKVNNRKMGYHKGITVSKVKFVPFNPGSGAHVAKFLINKHGWKPTEFTEKTGEPVVSMKVLKQLKYPEAPLLLKCMVVDKRLGQLVDGKEGWLNHVRESGAIHGDINTMGTVTSRMSHYRPNLAQVPAVGPYGEECRSLFKPREGFVLVGCDAAALEACCLAHYLYPYDKGIYAERVFKGDKEQGTDVHSVNMKSLNQVVKGINRNTAKTFFYAWLYGAGARELASILGCTMRKAKIAEKAFIKGFTGMKQLKTKLKEVLAKRRWIVALDGRQIPVRSEHSALNTIFQSAGAVIMKWALVLADLAAQEAGMTPGREYEFLLLVHDEWQAEVWPERAEEFGKLSVAAIKQAGIHLKMNIPLDGEYLIGPSWADTH